jgi:hypothetical protein
VGLFVVEAVAAALHYDISATDKRKTPEAWQK